MVKLFFCIVQESMFELLTDKKARLNFLNAEPMYGRNNKEAFVCSNSNGNKII